MTIDDASGTVKAAGLTFNAPGSGSYTIAASGGDTLTLNGASPVISVSSGVSATISAPITGAFSLYAGGSTINGLTIKGLGTLTLSGNNTYTGSTIIENNGAASTGIAVTLSGGSLGTAAANVYVGLNPTAAMTDTSSLAMANSTVTASNFVVDYNFAEGAVSATAGSTVTVSGTSTINADTISVVAGRNSGNTKGGYGSIALASGATLNLNGSAGNDSVTLLDIADYSFETGGATGTGITGSVDFSAGTVNGAITTVNVGTGKAGTGTTSGDSGPATGTLSFANGSLTIGQLNIARLGSENAVGTLNLVAGGTGTLTAGTGKGSQAITFGATGNGTQNTINTKAISVINISGATLAVNGDIIANPNGSGDFSSSTSTINLNGGTLNMEGNNIGPSGNAITLNASSGTLENVNSINASGNGSPGLTTSGAITQTLVLTGTNSYTGITTIGGDTVIANGASSMGTGGALVVNSGLLDLDGFSQVVGGLSGTGGTITNNGTSAPANLIVTGGTGSFAGIIQDGKSSIGLSLLGGSVNMTSSTAQTYSGTTSISSGASLTIANINSSTATTVDGTLTAAGKIGTLLIDQGGTLTPGPAVASGNTGTLSASSLTIGSGGASMDFLINSPTAMDELSLPGSATLNGGLTINASLGGSLAAGTYTLVNAPGGLSLNGNSVSSNIIVGSGGTTRTSASVQENSTQIYLNVVGSPASLVWTDGSTSTNWEDQQQDANWTRTDSGTVGASNQFYDGDNVTFDSTHNGDAKPNYTVNITSNVAPGSVTFTNGSSTNYSINGNGIGGSGGLTVNSSDGTGSVTLNNNNTYAGATTVTAGTLNVAGSIAGSGLSVAAGATANVGGTVNSTAININGTLTASGTLAGTTLTLTGSSANATISSGGNLNTPTVNITGGLMTVQSGGNLNATSITVASGASLSVQSGANLNNAPNLIDNGAVTLADPTIGTLNGTTAAATLTLNANDLTINSGGSFAGQIIDNGTGASLDVGTGNTPATTLVLTGANTYSGTTHIHSNATLEIDAGSNTGSMNPNSSIQIDGSAVLAFDRSDNPTISNTMNGTGAIRQLGAGTLTLTGSNANYSGAIQVYNGTIAQGATNANTLGSGGEILALGTPGNDTTTTPAGTLLLSSSVPATSFGNISAANSSLISPAVPNVLNIPAGVTLSSSGTVSVGTNFSTVQTNNIYTALQVTGGGSFSTTNTITIGEGNSYGTADFSGLNSFTLNNGTLNIGSGAALAGSLTLANTTVAGNAPVNTINTPAINIATSGSGDTPGGVSYLYLGSGTNILEASAFNLGTGRGSGVIAFAPGAPTTTTVTIADQGGGGGAPMILANASTNGTFIGTGSLLNLAGYNATVQVSSLTVAENTGNLAGGAIGGVTFDTGSFTVNGAVLLAADTGGSSTAGPTGSITIGGPNPNSSATGVFTINGTVTLGDFTNTNAFAEASAVATATLTINGGTLNINGSINNNSTTGTTVSTLTLAGGTLNMNNNSIGSNGAANSGNNPITTNFESGTLENVSEINGGSTGLVKIGNGTLTITDNNGNYNNYSGGTTVDSGTLIIGSTTALGQGGLTVDNSAIARLQPNLGAPFQFAAANLSIVSGGTLDITNNAVVIHNGTLSTINSEIAAGVGPSHNWTGAGITSSSAASTPGTAVGVMLNSDSSGNAIYSNWPTTGNSVGVSNTDVLVMYTWYGDLNLDGAVNSADLSILTHDVGITNANWAEGDLNYDGVVNADDFSLFQLGDAESAGRNITALPEPALLGLCALPLFSLRRRTRVREIIGRD